MVVGSVSHDVTQLRDLYYCSENTGKIRVMSIKVALATMCAGKLMDKLRCLFPTLNLLL